jgi:hypothetical protein
MMSGAIATAETYMAPVKERLQRGFTSGDFVTGNLANSVARGDPQATGEGVEIVVGSTQVNPDYATPWELGHHNLYTGKHERVEVWVPLMVQMRDQLVKVMADEIRAVDGAL